MTHLAFFIAVVAASLLWSAAMTAAATRVQRPWLQQLLIALEGEADEVLRPQLVAVTGELEA